MSEVHLNKMRQFFFEIETEAKVQSLERLLSKVRMSLKFNILSILSQSYLKRYVGMTWMSFRTGMLQLRPQSYEVKIVLIYGPNFGRSNWRTRGRRYKFMKASRGNMIQNSFHLHFLSFLTKLRLKSQDPKSDSFHLSVLKFNVYLSR